MDDLTQKAREWLNPARQFHYDVRGIGGLEPMLADFARSILTEEADRLEARAGELRVGTSEIIKELTFELRQRYNLELNKGATNDRQRHT